MTLNVLCGQIDRPRVAGDECLHPVGAGQPHFVGTVAVKIQRKGRCGMTEVLLHGFDVVPGTDGIDRIGGPIGYNREQSEKPCKFNGLTTPKYSFSHDI